MTIATANRPLYHDLRNLIAQPHQEDATVAVRSSEPLINAYQHMKEFGISQLPVLDNNRLVGIIDEATMLAAVTTTIDAFHKPVHDIMQRNITYLPHDASLEQLQIVLANHPVAVIMDDGEFLGFISRIDLLTHLEKHSHN